MTSYIRLYESPRTQEGEPGTVIGFSRSIDYAAQDPSLHQGLEELGYAVTPETKRQIEASYAFPPSRVFRDITQEYVEIGKTEGVPIPAIIKDETVRSLSVSISHLLVEPPIVNDDLFKIAKLLKSATEQSVDSSQIFLIDNRNTDPMSQPSEYPPLNKVRFHRDGNTTTHPE